MIAEKRHINAWNRSHGESPIGLSLVIEDWVATERNLAVRLNRQPLLSMSCSPVDCKDLVLGYLYTEQIIAAVSDIDLITFDAVHFVMNVTAPDLSSFDHDAWQKRRSLSTGCGGGSSSRMEYRRKTLRPFTEDVGHSIASILTLIEYVRSVSEWYAKTGGVHIGVLAVPGNVIVREDIGRHNAIDKAIGAGLLCDIDFSSALLYCSGRASSDMVMKAAQARIPMIISRSAPTSLAVDIATETGLTLIGFARGKRFNVYSNPERLHSDQLMETSAHATRAPRSQSTMQ